MANDDSNLNHIHMADSNLNQVHMANERTFLSWLRTSLGLMAFGFLIDRFTYFSNRIAAALGVSNYIPPSLITSLSGISLVILGALMGLLAFIKFKRDKLHIDAKSYRASSTLGVLATLLLLAIGVALVIFLLST